MGLLQSIGRQTLGMLLDSSLFLLFGFALAGIMAWRIPSGGVARHLGGRGMKPVLLGALAGAPLPLCSCSVVPAAATLRRKGAGKGSVMAFLISGPETGVESIALTYALMGPVIALFRPLAALAAGALGGFLTDALERSEGEERKGASAPEACCAPGEGGGEEGLPEVGSFRGAMEYAFGELLMEVAPWLIAGILFAGLLSALLPENFFAHTLGSGLFSMLVMIAIGVPMYVCASSSTPLALAMMAKGLNPGAALVFLLAGPATNAGTLGVVARLFGRKAAGAYLAAIVIAALAAGTLLGALAEAFPDALLLPLGPAAGRASASGLLALAKSIGAVALVLLIARGFARRGRAQIASMLRECREALMGR
ncbi:MAG: SO_0444 family Cu/Zn efflux transporter [bacterium]